MFRNAQFCFNEFSHSVKHQRTTLYFLSPVPSHTRQALERLIEQPSSAKRISAPLDCADSALFLKREPLDSIKKKWRMQRCAPKRNGLYDWPLEELINTREATRRGARTAALLGYGYSRCKLGLMKDFFLISRSLTGHVDGMALIERNPHAVEAVIEATAELLHALHSQGITHMDLWAANVMLPEQGSGLAQAIDLENSFFTPTAFFSETLGFQFGFLYHRKLYRYITEAAFDRLVEQSLATYFAHVDRAAFGKIYEVAKHQVIDRLERREIFSKGVFKRG